MQELIKGSIKQVVVDGDVPISNRIHINVKPEGNGSHPKGNREADFELDFDDELSETGEPKERAPKPEPEPERPTIDMHELEELRAHFRREGEEQAQSIKRKAEIELAHAKEDAEKIRQQAQNERMEKLRAMEADTAKALEKAKQEGYDIGYGEGLKKGSDDGYAQGLKKCKDTLLDLKNICDGVEKEKASLMAENRRAIFDIALTVAEKITMVMFTQKDKQALEKMITEAAKEFRSAKSVRVTLSKLDLGEDIEADLNILEKCFSETVNVEFEILDEAERGTLLVETDSEILDAGVSTQLRMIEELGKGKFRDKEPDGADKDEAEDIGEVLKAETPKKTKKADKPQETKTAAEEAAQPAVEEAAESVVEEAAQPAAEEAAESVVEEAAQPSVEAAAQPAAEEAAQPSVEAAAQPAAEEAAVPVAEEAAQPVVEAAAKPAADGAASKMSQDDIAALLEQAAALAGTAQEETSGIIAEEQEATEEQ